MANQRPASELRLQAPLQSPLVRPGKTTPPFSPLIPARAVVAQSARGARGGASCALCTSVGRALVLELAFLPGQCVEPCGTLPVAACPPASGHCGSALANPPKGRSLSSTRPPASPVLRPAASRLGAAFSPGGAGPLRAAPRNLAHAPARVRPVPCTRPAPPHGAHTYVRGPRPASSLRAPGSCLLAPSFFRRLPRECPAASQTIPAAKRPPRGGLQPPQLPHPAAPRRARDLPTPRLWARTATHPASPSWLSVARGGPPFLGSSSVCIVIRAG